MKQLNSVFRLLLYAAMLLFGPGLVAQVSFGPRKVVHEPDTKRVIGVFTADLDDDGDQDVLTASYDDNKIAWYQNAGDGHFSRQILVSVSAEGAKCVYAADLDNDGDQDVLSASSEDDKIAWYPNNGAGDFGQQRIISLNMEAAFAVVAADLDRDGDMDVLSASEGNNKIIWYSNDGTGHFDSGQPVYSGTNKVWVIFVADLNGDDNLDVLATTYEASTAGSAMVWFENNGAGAFSAPVVITDTPGGSIYVADLDNDGDNDVLWSLGNLVLWHQNDGMGSFGQPQTITDDEVGVHSIYASDLDADGDLDVLTASYDGGYLVSPPIEISRVAWFRNLGNGTFGPAQVLSTAAYGENRVYAADLNGDGAMDALSVSSGDNKVVWYANDHVTGFGTQQVINDPVVGAHDVSAMDIDGDGDLDVFSRYQSSWRDENQVGLAWYEQVGNGQFDAQHVVFRASLGVDRYDVADLDGDGYPDVIGTDDSYFSQGGIKWSRNDGVGNFGPPQYIAPDTSYEKVLFVADLDADGDQDIISTLKVITWGGTTNQSILWRKNDGSGHFSASHLIWDVFGISNVLPFDPDGDGDVDLLYLPWSGSSIFWLENSGAGVFGAEQSIATVQWVRSMLASDFDGDGDVDIISNLGNKIAWHENDGTGNFGAPQIISTSLPTSATYTLSDLDNDGDQDVVYGSYLIQKIAWVENLGGGQFAEHTAGISDAGYVSSVSCADLDGDGDQDIVATLYDGSVTWYENLLKVNASDEPSAATRIRIYPNPSSGQMAWIVLNQMDVGADKRFDLQIFNLRGQTVYAQRQENSQGAPVALPKLPSGVYFVTFSTEYSRQTLRWVVQ